MPALFQSKSKDVAVKTETDGQPDLEQTQTNLVGDVQEKPAEDAVFGEDGAKYRSMKWWAAAILMMKAQIGLGVLSIPTAFHTLGMIPGLICVCLVGGITTWSDYMVGVFKLNHPDVYNIDEAMGKVLGRWGREFTAIIYVLYWIFVAGSGMLGLSIGLNAVSNHATCTAFFTLLAAGIGFCFGSIQTLGRISWLAWVGLLCIMSSIFVVTVGVGIQDRPAAAPLMPLHFESDWKFFNNPSFADAVTAVSSIVFAFSGTPAFFGIISEMKNQRHATRAVAACQGLVTMTYITIGCVVYYYCGSYVSSPALGSAGATVKRIAYGIALPGLAVSTLLFIHFPAKYVFVRKLRGTRDLCSGTVRHYAWWFGCTFSATLVAFLIANVVPVFNSLVSLVGALLGTMMCFQPMGLMWLYDNWKIAKSERNARWWCMVGFSIFVIIAGCFIQVAGSYGTIVGIMNEYKASGGTKPFSCADNSNSAGGH